jgi:anti-sigma factor RsiW
MSAHDDILRDEHEGEGMPSPELLELMAYADGEVDDDDRARIEARLATDRAYAAQLRVLSALGDFTRDEAPRIYERARVDDVADTVMARLAEDRDLPANDIEAAPASTLATRRRRATFVWGAVGIVAAAAAAFALYVSGHPDGRSNEHQATIASTSTPTTQTTATDTIAVAPTPPKKHVEEPVAPPPQQGGVEVEDLEVGEGATVIYASGQQGAVVWVTDKR